MVRIYQQSLETAKKFGEQYNMVMQFTPVHFLRIFECYRRLLRERHTVVKNISKRYEAGLQKIKETQDQIFEYHQALERKSPQLQNRLRQIFRIIGDIEEEFGRIKGQSDQLRRDEFEMEEQTNQA